MRKLGIKFSKTMSILLIAVMVAGLSPYLPEAAAGSEKTQRVSVSGSTEGNSYSDQPAITPDGRYVAFSSAATNLVEGDTNGTCDIFVYDRQTGVTTRVSVDSSGTQSDGDSLAPDISDDGRYITFYSDASNLVSGDANGHNDVFVHDTQTGDTTRVSVSSSGVEGNLQSHNPAISSDGTLVVFKSEAFNLVDGKDGGIYVHNRTTGATIWAGTHTDPEISGNGRYVAFTSNIALLPETDTNGLNDVYVYDMQTSQYELISRTENNDPADSTSSEPSISADGRYVAFTSDASNLVAGDTNGMQDIFVRDRQTGAIERISPFPLGEGSYNPRISPDGMYVSFTTYAALVAEDTNADEDVYVYDRSSGTLMLAGLTNSDLLGNGPSYSSAMANQYVAFVSSSTDLVDGDTNGQDDVFVRFLGTVEPPVWQKLYASSAGVLAIKSDGSLWGWGFNTTGRLGDGTIASKSLPVQTTVYSDWVTVSTGSSHSAGIRVDGSLWTWGRNWNGGLGDGTTDNKSYPVRVGTGTNWKTVSVGGDFTIALKQDGSLWSWGTNFDGQLGLGNSGNGTEKTTPQRIGMATDWSYIYAGNQHAFAIKSNGTLWGWGYNGGGQLGTGDTNNRTSPVQIGPDATWTSVASRSNHTLAMKNDGSLWAWGDNSYGKLGDGSDTDRLTAVQISVYSDWEKIDTGQEFSVGIRNGGEVWAWGWNLDGQLGNGTRSNEGYYDPARVGTDNSWIDIKAGALHVIGLKSDNAIWTWGRSDNGQLGLGTMTSRTFPVMVTGEKRPITVASASPSDGLTGIAVNAPVSVTFEDWVQAGENTASVAMTDQSGNRIDYSYTITGNTVTFDRYSILNNDTTYTVTFPNEGIQDVEAYSFSFSTGTDPFNFKRYAYHQVGWYPTGLTAGDFNKDNKKDIAVVNELDHNISIALGNGDGTFQPSTNIGYLMNSRPSGVECADINGDTNPDLVVVRHLNNTVAVFFGNGDGTFQEPVAYAVGTRPLMADTGDFDGDNDIDIAVVNRDSNNVSVLLNNGEGTFANAVNYATGSSPYWVTAADLNGDNRPEMISANNSNNNISVFINNGNGTYQDKTDYFAGSSPSCVAVGDLDNDNNLDVLVINDDVNYVSTLMGNGNGTLQGRVSQSIPEYTYPPSGTIADLNGDGNNDLIIATEDNDTVTVRLGNGDGTFQDAVSFAAGNSPRGIIAEDLNGDSKLDLIATANGFSRVAVLINESSGAAPITIDTENWVLIDSVPTSNTLEEVAFGNDQFVAAGYGGTILSSSDGINWTVRDAGTFLGFHVITYGNGLFLAAGWNGQVYTSPDGVTWTASNSGITDNFLNGSAYGDGSFVLVGNSGWIKRSNDTATWANGLSNCTKNMTSVVYGEDIFVSVGQEGIIYTSGDAGANWTQETSGVNVMLSGVAYGNGTFVAVGSGGTILTSPDGSVWTERSSGIATDLFEVAYDYGTFIAVGAQGKILTSTDGINWSQKTSGTSSDLFGIASGNEAFVVVGKTGIILKTGTSTGEADATAPTWGPGSSISASGVNQTSLSLNWASAADNVGVVSYRVYKDGSLLGTVAGTTYNVTDLTANTSYTFAVQAGDAAGNWSTDGPTLEVTTASEPDTPPEPDITPPTVNSAATVPAANATNVEVNPTIVIPFSENIQEGASYGDITLRDADSNNVSITKAISASNLTMTLSSDLSYNTVYTVTVPAGAVKDYANNSLAGQFGLSFTTRSAPSSGGGSSTPVAKTELSASASINPTIGSVVQNATGTLKLEVPSGAIQNDTAGVVNIQVAQLPKQEVKNLLKDTKAPEGFKAIGTAFEFKAEAMDDGKATVITSFTKPVVFSIDLKQGELASVKDAEKVGLFKLNDDGSLTFVGGKVVKGRLVVEMYGFSRYVLAEVDITFSDLGNHWAKQDVERMAAKYVVRGYPAGEFKPSEQVTRAEFAAMLVRAMGLLQSEEKEETTFKDVKADDWYHAAVLTAVKAGIVKGYVDGTFKPDALVTREEAAVMITQALKIRDKAEVLTDLQLEGALGTFADKRDVSSWARYNVALAIQEDIIQGQTVKTIAPKATATRAEAAVMIGRYWEK